METSKETICFDFHTELKKFTKDLHEELDQLPISRQLTSSELTVEEYCNYLKKFYPACLLVEKKFFPFLETLLPDLNDRIKSYKIVQDLSFFKQAPGKNESLFFKEDFTINFALGVLYVMEGSTLGGIYILKNVRTALGLTEEGCNFMNCYGRETGIKWKHFLEVLNKYSSGVTEAAREEIREGAAYAFKEFRKALQ